MFRLSLVGVAVAALIPMSATGGPLSGKAVPSPGQAYVGGVFTTVQTTFTSAFVVTNQETGRGYYVPFTSHIVTHAGNVETLLIQLPAGPYRVTDWIVYNSWRGPSVLGGREFKRPMPDSLQSQTFRLVPGDVLFLGRFMTDIDYRGGMLGASTDGRWRAERITDAEARAALAAAYPNFAQAPFACLTCAPEASPQP